MKPPLWKRFRFIVGKNDLLWMTPLFALWISDAGYDFLTDSYWWGMMFCWKLRKVVHDGEFYFLHDKEWVMIRIPVELVEQRKILI